MIDLKDFYFVRHGETDWNLERRAMGQRDVPLNQRGELQAEQAAHLLKTEGIKNICHSPLIRAKKTAQIISDFVGAPLIEIPELIESCLGEQEGQLKGKWIDAWFSGAKISGAESYENFLLRALQGIDKSISNPGPVLIVSRGGVFLGIQKFTQVGAKYGLKNCLPILMRAPKSIDHPWGIMPIDPNEEL